MIQLRIISSGKPAELHKFIKPVLDSNGVCGKVFKPEDFTLDTEASATLFMGAKAFDVLRPLLGANPKHGIGTFREKCLELKGNKFLVSYDPSLVQLFPEREPEIIWDLQLACRLAWTGKLEPTVGFYFYEEDFKAMISDILESEGRVAVSMDLETIGLDEFAPEARIVTVSFSYKNHYSLVYYCPPEGPSKLVLDQVKFICSDSKIKLVGANLKYDIRWLKRQWGVDVLNQVADTQLMGGLLSENRSNSLNLHTKIYAPHLGGYDDVFNDTFDKSRMDLIPKSDLLNYAGGDTDACLQVYHAMKKDLARDPQLLRFYTRLLHPASLVFAKMENRGVVVDGSRYDKLKEEAELEIAQSVSDCWEHVPNKIKIKYQDNLSLTRDVILVDYLFSPNGLNLKPLMMTPKGDKPSTAKNHLKSFIDHPKAGPFIKSLMAYKSASKTLSTYILGFKKHLRSDGMFHPSYMLAKGSYGDGDDSGGTDTGRTSCRDPAYQTIPKRTVWAKRLRYVFVRPPGYVICKLDYSQGELRLMADQSGDPTMIRVYREGKDLHAVTACAINGITMEQFYALSVDEQELMRYGAKAGNFGLIYQISVPGFVEFAATSYNVQLTMAQAQTFYDRFFETYPRVLTYHGNQIDFAKKNGFVRSPLGRIRHLPLINSKDVAIRSRQERQAINSSIQGTLSDFMQLLMVQIDKWNPNLWMFGTTHDSLEMYLKENSWESDIKTIKDLAENLPLSQFGYTPKVPFVVDFEVSFTDMSELKKYKVPE